MSRAKPKHLPIVIASLIFLSLACNLPAGTSPSVEVTNPTPLIQGPTPTAEPTLTPRPASDTTSRCTYQARLESSSLPFGAGVQTGQSFTQTWRLHNTGTCRWQAAALEFAGGNLINSSSKNWQIPQTAPGGIAEFDMTLQAPQQPGTYRADWQLINRAGHAFGPQTLPVVVQVSRTASSSGGSGSGSGSGSQSPGFGGIGNFIPGVVDDLLNNFLVPPLTEAEILPSPIEIAVGNLDPELVDALELESIPDLADKEQLSPDEIYVDPFPRELLTGDDSPSKNESPPDPPPVSLDLTLNGLIKTSEYKAFKSRNLSTYPIIRKRFPFGPDRAAGRFSVEHCESGKDNIGVMGTLAVWAELMEGEDGEPEIVVAVHHLVYAANCKDDSLRYNFKFKQDKQITRYIFRLGPGESKHIDSPWISDGNAGSSKVILDFKVEPNDN